MVPLSSVCPTLDPKSAWFNAGAAAAAPSPAWFWFFPGSFLRRFELFCILLLLPKFKVFHLSSQPLFTMVQWWFVSQPGNFRHIFIIYVSINTFKIDLNSLILKRELFLDTKRCFNIYRYLLPLLFIRKLLKISIRILYRSIFKISETCLSCEWYNFKAITFPFFSSPFFFIGDRCLRSSARISFQFAFYLFLKSPAGPFVRRFHPSVTPSRPSCCCSALLASLII